MKASDRVVEAAKGELASTVKEEVVLVRAERDPLLPTLDALLL